MTIEEYRRHTVRTLPDLCEDIIISAMKGLEGTNAKREFAFKLGADLGTLSKKLNLSHMVMGLVGEFEEIIEVCGTELRATIDTVKLAEEIGDVYWYLANYCNLRGIPIPEVPELAESEDQCFDLLIEKTSRLVDMVKKYVAYNREIDKVNEAETIYDIRVALQLFEDIYDLDGGEIREKNIAKLKVRYPDKFNDDNANNRDLDSELKALE